MFILNPADLVNVYHMEKFSSRVFMYRILSANRDMLSSSFLVHILFISTGIAIATTSSTILTRMGKTDIPVLFLILVEIF